MEGAGSDHAYWGRIISRLEVLGRKAQVQEEQRRSKRYGYGRWIGLVEVICCEEGDRRIWVQGRNLSQEGFGFLHVRSLRVGGRCTVMLKALDGQLVPTSADIRRCRDIEEGIWELGVEFVESIEIKRFIVIGGTDSKENEPLGT